MRRYLWLALAVISLAALLVPFVSGLVRELLLVELLRLVWKVDGLIDSLPQEPFWVAFLFIAALVALISVLPRSETDGQSQEAAQRGASQVADLALLIRRAGRRPYFRRRLVQRLSQLGREVFAHRHGVDVQELRDRLRQAAGSSDREASLKQALAQLRTEPSTLRGVQDPAVELFVQFLEDQLEVENGPFHRSRR